jgi:hypothetical protein
MDLPNGSGTQRCVARREGNHSDVISSNPVIWFQFASPPSVEEIILGCGLNHVAVTACENSDVSFVVRFVAVPVMFVPNVGL